MIKKAIFAGVGVSLLGLFLFGRDAASYVGTSVGWVKDSVKDAVPIEFEIERARKMVRDIVPDIRKNMHVIAREEVEIERLAEQISKSEDVQLADKENILRLKNDLSAQQVSFTYGGRTFSRDQVKVDLANRFERFKTRDATLASLREMHHARLASLDAARQKLEGMLASKRQLEVEVQNLEARLKMVEAAQTTSSATFDDSRLSRAKELITDLRSRLEVAERLVDSEGAFQGEIPLTEPVPEEIVDEVTEYFDGSSDDAPQAEVAQTPAA
jgi:predicted  nucleic acid-binding Zn-ribbon protein